VGDVISQNVRLGSSRGSFGATRWDLASTQALRPVEGAPIGLHWGAPLAVIVMRGSGRVPEGSHFLTSLLSLPSRIRPRRRRRPRHFPRPVQSSRKARTAMAPGVLGGPSPGWGARVAMACNLSAPEQRAALSAHAARYGAGTSPRPGPGGRRARVMGPRTGPGRGRPGGRAFLSLLPESPRAGRDADPILLRQCVHTWTVLWRASASTGDALFHV
jgi:hypothetical protein